MILEINQPYGLNFEEDLEFVGNYQKGKRKTKNIYDLRFLFKGVKTGEEYLLVLDEDRKDPNPIFGGDQIGIIGLFYPEDETRTKKGTNYTHLKNGVYNYYLTDDSPEIFAGVLEAWRNSNPPVHVGNYGHQRINSITNYTWAYRWNGKEY